MKARIRVAVLVIGMLAVGAANSTAQDGADELVGVLTKELAISAEQARGGAGSVFSLAKAKMSPVDLSQVAKAVPGMDGLLKAAPAGGGAGGLGSLGAMAALAPAFQKLGISPAVAARFIPVVTQFVGSKAGADVAKLLTAALK